MNYHREPVGIGNYQEGQGYESYEEQWVPNSGTIADFPMIWGSIGAGSQTNAGYGPGAANFRRLLTDAWNAAVAQGRELAKDCRCECTSIRVLFICQGNEARRAGGAFCGRERQPPFPCQANAIGTDDCEEK